MIWAAAVATQPTTVLPPSPFGQRLLNGTPWSQELVSSGPVVNDETAVSPTSPTYSGPCPSRNSHSAGALGGARTASSGIVSSGP